MFKDPLVIMSWLSKDLIVTVAWLNFDHAQSNSKKWPKKIKLPQMNFLEKQLIKFSCTYLPLSLCKKFLEPIQSYQDMPFLGQKCHICPEIFFFVQTVIITFIYLLALFIVQNFKKILPANPELWGCAIFGLKIGHLSKWEFFQKTC